jgi:hypothetical protein
MFRSLIVGATRLVVGVVLVFSGAYLLIYLYRWEWNRAIISGLFFVSAEIALATSMITRRLRALESRSVVTPASSQRVVERLRATPVTRRAPFEWLNSATRRGPNVFVPVLLGAGVILSALAYVVERIAEATAVPFFDRRLARRLAVLTPPADGVRRTRLAGDAAVTQTPRHRPGRILATMIGLTAVAVLAWIGVLVLLDATQSRPDPTERPSRTTAELTISQRGTGQDVANAAEALWIGCRSTLGSLDTQATVVGLGGDRVALILEPGIGRLHTRRLTGCLSDLRVDLVRAHVVAVHHEDSSVANTGGDR